MANVLISSRCNRKCSFCFASQRLGKNIKSSADVNMSREDLRKVMQLFKRSGEDSLRLLGGEPTLHPEFREIVEEAISEGFRVQVFTNGFMKPEVADFLGDLPDDKVGLLCNVSPQAKDTQKQLDKLAYALERLGQKVRLGVTLSTLDMDYEFLVEYIDRFKIQRRLRLGIAQPIVGRENECLLPEDYREAGRFIVGMAKDLYSRDIIMGFDCGLTLCMFDDEELGSLFRITEGFKMVCSPIIDIGPQMDVWHCFPLSEVLVTDFSAYENYNGMVRRYEKFTQPYYALGCKPECITCKYLKSRQCTGGCLAHAMNSLNRLPARYIGEDGPA
ncbi:MAG: radical SAM protein [Thermodesulfovibrionales bacterium]|nr:radical SAM protein [Thermodesulfovibrionales bacterium]